MQFFTFACEIFRRHSLAVCSEDICTRKFMDLQNKAADRRYSIVQFIVTIRYLANARGCIDAHEIKDRRVNNTFAMPLYESDRGM